MAVKLVHCDMCIMQEVISVILHSSQSNMRWQMAGKTFRSKQYE